MEQVRKVKLRDGRTVEVRGPIKRIPSVDPDVLRARGDLDDALILPRDYRGGNHSAVDVDPEDDPGNTNIEVAHPTSTEETYRRAELGVLYEAMTEHLTARERKIVRNHCAGFSFREIAWNLSEPQDAVESAYYRAVKKIKKIVNG